MFFYALLMAALILMPWQSGLTRNYVGYSIDEFSNATWSFLDDSGTIVQSPISPAADDDGDGLINSGEYAAGSDPFNSDTMHHGIGDGDEVTLGYSTIHLELTIRRAWVQRP